MNFTVESSKEHYGRDLHVTLHCETLPRMFLSQSSVAGKGACCDGLRNSKNVSNHRHMADVDDVSGLAVCASPTS
jgi:hypothetical protein